MKNRFKRTLKRMTIASFAVIYITFTALILIADYNVWDMDAIYLGPGGLKSVPINFRGHTLYNLKSRVIGRQFNDYLRKHPECDVPQLDYIFVEDFPVFTKGAASISTNWTEEEAYFMNYCTPHDHRIYALPKGVSWEKHCIDRESY